MSPDPQKRHLPFTNEETEAHGNEMHRQGCAELNQAWAGSIVHVCSTILRCRGILSVSFNTVFATADSLVNSNRFTVTLHQVWAGLGDKEP